MGFLSVVIALVSAGLFSTVHVNQRVDTNDVIETRRFVAEPGDSVIEAMFARWNNRAYRTATLVQNTQFADGRKQLRYESVRTPGLLRIDLTPLDSGGTLLFREDSVYAGRKGRWSDARPYVHALQILLTDVYWVPTNATTRLLRVLGFDLSVAHTETWRGRSTTIVGAQLGDTLSPQFWVDRERLIVVRIIERERQPGAGSFETRVVTHTKAGESWVASELAFLQAGRELQRETYTDIHVDVPLDMEIFLPTGYTLPEWLKPRLQK